MCSKKMVLVIDDADGARRVLKAMLEPAFTVVPLEDGPSAMTYARSGEVYAAFVDYAMPVMDGCAVCEELKAIDPTISLIGLSANEHADFGQPLFAFIHKDRTSKNEVVDIAARAVTASEQRKKGGGTN